MRSAHTLLLSDSNDFWKIFRTVQRQRHMQHKMQLSHWTIVAWVLPIIARTYGSWGEPGSSQYHIQTDEGPERYFRFQTDNGQFRKEKRLQDGTVIGTEAWIDAAGFLRQKDYIADTKGYRILKSKTVFVGHGRPVEDAIKSTKSVPAQSGVLVDGTRGLSQNSVDHTGLGKQNGYVYSTTTPIPLLPSSTAISTLEDPTKLNYLSPAEAAKIEPSPYLGFDHYPDELLPPKLPSQRNSHVHAPPTPRRRVPTVQIRPHALPIEQVVDEVDDGFDVHSNSIIPFSREHEHTGYSTTARPLPTPVTPSLSMEPPFETHNRHLGPIAVIASSPAPIVAEEAVEQQPAYDFSTPTPFTAPPRVTTRLNGHGYNYAPFVATPHTQTADDDRYATPLDVNSLDSGLLPPLSPVQTRYRNAQRFLNGNAIPDDYDGIAMTRNGFRYVLPHQYHEEAQVEDKRAGSFGYVDPFGIRRVVYYNASPERGFVHRNNNRYVGLGATPYDPIGPAASSDLVEPNVAKYE